MLDGKLLPHPGPSSEISFHLWNQLLIVSQLKEQLDLNSGTRGLILTVLATVYIPLAFVSSYFGMNARQFTNGGFVSTGTFWQVSIPLVVASIIIPVAFSGLLIRVTMQVLRWFIGKLWDPPFSVLRGLIGIYHGSILILRWERDVLMSSISRRLSIDWWKIWWKSNRFDQPETLQTSEVYLDVRNTDSDSNNAV